MFAVIAERMPRGNSTEPPRRRTHLRSSRRSRFRCIVNRLPQNEPCVTFEPPTNPRARSDSSVQGKMKDGFGVVSMRVSKIPSAYHLELKMFAVVAEWSPRCNSTESPRRRTLLRSSRRSRFRYIANYPPQNEPCVTFEMATNSMARIMAGIQKENNDGIGDRSNESVQNTVSIPPVVRRMGTTFSCFAPLFRH